MINIKEIFLFIFIIMLTAGCLKNNNKTNIKKGEKMKGKISVIERNYFKIHSYISPEEGALVTTHIIETENNLVVVDVQFLKEYAKEVNEYAQNLNKPVERIIITHSHPDHWFGLEYFNNIPIYSLIETKNEINEMGDMIIESKKSVLGDLVTSKKFVPNKIINEWVETIDGLKYKFEKIENAESDFQLLIKLPDQKILIAQDLVYNNVHMFIGQNAFDEWIGILRNLKELNEYELILPGHGEPADSNIYEDTINYLKDAKEIFSSVDSGEALKKRLIAKYPEYRAPVLLDISNSFLYK